MRSTGRRETNADAIAPALRVDRRARVGGARRRHSRTGNWEARGWVARSAAQGGPPRTGGRGKAAPARQPKFGYPNCADAKPFRCLNFSELCADFLENYSGVTYTAEPNSQVRIRKHEQFAFANPNPRSQT